MPTVPVNEAGAVIYYEDSGAPGGSLDYLTIVIVHGLVFHGRGFTGTFPFAADRNLRIVALNLRDYPNSTPYDQSELDLLCSLDAAKQAAAIRAQGQEIASFLKNFILAENIPPVREVAGKKTGGLALLSWSLGNVWGMSMLAHATSLDEETVSVLQQWLRTWVMYDPPHYPFGVSLPKEIYYPIEDECLTMEQRGVAFGRWITAFWTPLSEPSSNPHELAARLILSDVDEDPQLLPTIERLTVEEREAITTPEVLDHSAKSLFTTENKVWWDNCQSALCEPDGALNHVNVLLIWCDMSPSVCLVGAKNIVDRLKEASQNGKATRDMKVLKAERANHFLHWHEPERFLQIVADNT